MPNSLVPSDNLRSANLSVFLVFGLTRSVFNLQPPSPRAGALTRGPLAFTICLRTKLAICQSSRSCTYTPFLPQRSKLSLFSLYEQQFLRYVPIFKIAIFGHETWSLAKVPEVAHLHITLVPPQRVEIELIFDLRAELSEIRVNFQNCHIWA